MLSGAGSRGRPIDTNLNPVAFVVIQLWRDDVYGHSWLSWVLRQRQTAHFVKKGMVYGAESFGDGFLGIHDHLFDRSDVLANGLAVDRYRETQRVGVGRRSGYKCTCGR